MERTFGAEKAGFRCWGALQRMSWLPSRSDKTRAMRQKFGRIHPVARDRTWKSANLVFPSDTLVGYVDADKPTDLCMINKLGSQMKSVKTIFVALVAAISLYGLAYWLLFREGLVFKLPSTSSDPFGTSELRRAVDTIFRPAREFDLRLTLDAPLRKRLIGNWSSKLTDDYVTISPDLACKFRLGRFEHEGVVKFERDYAGYSTEFRQGDVTHIFILSIDGGLHAPPLPENVATAFVGHDPRPGYREGDHEAQLTKQAEQVAGANRVPAR